LTEAAQATGGEAQEAPAPKLGTPEYDQAMAEKFRAAKDSNSPFEAPTADLQVAKVDAPARPDNVPEKFWDAERGAVNTEALLKSYGELEGRQSKAQEVQSQETEAAAQEAVTKAGLNYETLAVKIAQTGKVDDADYAALGAAGITKDVVDSYIELVSYKAAAEAEKAIAYVGGQEATDKLMKWAAANIPESEGVSTQQAPRRSQLARRHRRHQGSTGVRFADTQRPQDRHRRLPRPRHHRVRLPRRHDRRNV
jgi:hypothetical protein